MEHLLSGESLSAIGIQSLSKLNEINYLIFICTYPQSRNRLKRSLTCWQIKITDTRKVIGKKVEKGARRMPRLSEAKKDAISCEKHRGSANRN